MKTVLCMSLIAYAAADLKPSSQPRYGSKLRQYNNGQNRNRKFISAATTVPGICTQYTADDKCVQFSNPNTMGKTNTASQPAKVLYMEPSAFSYQKLQNQRANNYDNFLRSNIDNEQDNRNFNIEAGKDHLPFRTYEGRVDQLYPHGTQANPGTSSDIQALQNRAAGTLQTQSTMVVMAPGETKIHPLRWNNPHASEIEVQIWLMKSTPPIIVPIKRPTCSGEGNQDNAIAFTIPHDFNHVDTSQFDAVHFKEQRKNGKGLCVEDDDCVLHVYAHSVETRQYASAFPIKIIGNPCAGASPPSQCSGSMTSQIGNAAAAPNDIKEAQTYSWPTSYDLKSYLDGKKGTPEESKSADINLVKICASGKRNDENGIVLREDVQTVVTNGLAYLYLCESNTAAVDRVKFIVTGGGAGDETQTTPPFEYKAEGFQSSSTTFVTAEVYGYNTDQPRIIKAKVQFQGALGRSLREIRTRRKLSTQLKAQKLAGQVNKPCLEMGFDLSKLNREVCLSAADPAADYRWTEFQFAVLISDVNNHAYQNSNYSPYSGQQHCHISRNLQAASVIHMTASNLGELGKNAIDNKVRNVAKTLNNQVNNLYKAYEKVANVVIDQLTERGREQTRKMTTDFVTNGNTGRNTGNLVDSAGHVQQLAQSFRAQEKGATSTKRLKTTTYVPSFKVNAEDVEFVKNLIAQQDENKYERLLSQKSTGDHYIQIYQTTMNDLLPVFQEAAAAGVTMQMPVYKDCPKDSMLSKCGETMADVTKFVKINANGVNDGGRYAGTQAFYERAKRLYNCGAGGAKTRGGEIPPETLKCFPKTDGKCPPNGLKPKIIKDSVGTCVSACPSCEALYTNSRLTFSFEKKGTEGYFVTSSTIDVQDAITIGEVDVENIQSLFKPTGLSIETDMSGECWTPSYMCTKADLDPTNEQRDLRCAGYTAEQVGDNGLEIESREIQNMCKDNECDNDSDLSRCKEAQEAGITGVSPADKVHVQALALGLAAALFFFA